MAIDGPFADSKLSGDRAIAGAGRDQPDHLQLAWRQ